MFHVGSKAPWFEITDGLPQYDQRQPSAAEAWDAELTQQRQGLSGNFGRWADDGMSAFDLSRNIDQLHDAHPGNVSTTKSR